ncbi:hypothetical protein RhiirA4_478875 [Rhizophagus irregularis]|uniref:Uncharacterized protein n=1 Tax=Rhizophagus irregularis TaxID=588596 RepID=A0A2I1HFN0_9GLOM|nr:hypothetical protein RhiirA4_478875 [Rhizophagus irregularis]
MGNKLIELLNTHADKLSLVITDSVKYSKTFRWAYRSEPIHPVALLLLKSYISNDLIGILRLHINTMKNIIKIMLPYMQICSIIIKTDLWKVRNQLWKTQRDVWGITKKSFIHYRELFTRTQRVSAAISRTSVINNNRDLERGYINPFNDFRNFKLDKDYLFILFSSSNFLHSGAFFTHLEGVSFSDNFISFTLVPVLLSVVEGDQAGSNVFKEVWVRPGDG